MRYFEVLHRDKSCKARLGLLKTKSGVATTPMFLPVGTAGVVKTLSYRELEEIGVLAFIANTYHLYLRPGIEVLKQFGGLHNFINWRGIVFTDSGGFQVYSLRKLNPHS
ncbi:MAG: tRNA-guanine transglycosylase, partial [Endomicrobia bacterium]|nr:tRNA-guanine transglycosylase [Endomicrobiia bacterium]